MNSHPFCGEVPVRDARGGSTLMLREQERPASGFLTSRDAGRLRLILREGGWSDDYSGRASIDTRSRRRPSFELAPILGNSLDCHSGKRAVHALTLHRPERVQSNAFDIYSVCGLFERIQLS